MIKILAIDLNNDIVFDYDDDHDNDNDNDVGKVWGGCEWHAPRIRYRFHQRETRTYHNLTRLEETEYRGTDAEN